MSQDIHSQQTHSEVYGELASVGPYGVRPGHALITVVEPQCWL